MKAMQWREKENATQVELS